LNNGFVFSCATEEGSVKKLKKNTSNLPDAQLKTNLMRWVQLRKKGKACTQEERAEASSIEEGFDAHANRDWPFPEFLKSDKEFAMQLFTPVKSRYFAAGMYFNELSQSVQEDNDFRYLILLGFDENVQAKRSLIESLSVDNENDIAFVAQNVDLWLDGCYLYKIVSDEFQQNKTVLAVSL